MLYVKTISNPLSSINAFCRPLGYSEQFVTPNDVIKARQSTFSIIRPISQKDLVPFKNYLEFFYFTEFSDLVFVVKWIWSVNLFWSDFAKKWSFQRYICSDAEGYNIFKWSMKYEIDEVNI